MLLLIYAYQTNNQNTKVAIIKRNSNFVVPWSGAFGTENTYETKEQQHKCCYKANTWFQNRFRKLKTYQISGELSRQIWFDFLLFSLFQLRYRHRSLYHLSSVNVILEWFTLTHLSEARVREMVWLGFEILLLRKIQRNGLRWKERVKNVCGRIHFRFAFFVISSSENWDKWNKM